MRQPGKALDVPGGRYAYRANEGDTFNEDAHRAAHLPRILVYTSPSTLVTTASCPIFPPRGGRIAVVHFNVTTAGATDTTLDVLIGGTTIFTGSSEYPTIVAGDLSTSISSSALADDDPHPGGDHDAVFRAFEKLQVQVVATGGAGGPLVAQLEIDWDP